MPQERPNLAFFAPTDAKQRLPIIHLIIFQRPESFSIALICNPLNWLCTRQFEG